MYVTLALSNKLYSIIVNTKIKDTKMAKPAKKENRITITTRLPISLKHDLHKVAKEHDLSMTDLIIYGIRLAIEDYKDEK